MTLPFSGHPDDRFAALSADGEISIFYFKQERPYRTMKFHEPIDLLFYIGEDDIVITKKRHVFRIDLNNAGVF